MKLEILFCKALAVPNLFSLAQRSRFWSFGLIEGLLRLLLNNYRFPEICSTLMNFARRHNTFSCNSTCGGVRRTAQLSLPITALAVNLINTNRADNDQTSLIDLMTGCVGKCYFNHFEQCSYNLEHDKIISIITFLCVLRRSKT